MRSIIEGRIFKRLHIIIFASKHDRYGCSACLTARNKLKDLDAS